jgi:NAD(P)-dependent dehydrogenase (short-subunit alcohol dehydrogenase family)
MITKAVRCFMAEDAASRKGARSAISWSCVLLLLSYLSDLSVPEPVPSESAVLITGTSSGIGLDAALRLDQLGFTVFAGVRKEKDAEMLRTKASAKMRPIIFDVTNDAHIESALAAVKASGLKLAALVNNAGVELSGTHEVLPVEDSLWVVKVNLLAPLKITRTFLPLLRAGGGRLVNVGSLFGRFAPGGIAAYSASKFAVEALSDSIRREMMTTSAPLSVSIVQPGFTETQMVATGPSAITAMRKGMDAEATEAYGPVMRAMAISACAQALLWTSKVSLTSDAIAHAVTSGRPKTRYTVRNWLPCTARPCLPLASGLSYPAVPRTLGVDVGGPEEPPPPRPRCPRARRRSPRRPRRPPLGADVATAVLATAACATPPRHSLRVRVTPALTLHLR